MYKATWGASIFAALTVAWGIQNTMAGEEWWYHNRWCTWEVMSTYFETLLSRRRIHIALQNQGPESSVVKIINMA